MSGTVEWAQALATEAHWGQVDKAGEPYIGHPARVAARLPVDDELGRAAAWLHDVAEDTEVTLVELTEVVPMEVVAAVDALTRRPGEGDHYYERVRANPVALRVKLADIADNTDPVRTAALEPAERDRLAAKYAHALDLLA